MPTVRRYGERQARISPLRGGFRQAAATPESEGAGIERARTQSSIAQANLGETIAHAGRAGFELFAKIAEEERREADKTALLKANNRIAEWKIKRLYAPGNGALNVKGEEALPLPEVVLGEFDSVANEVEASLTTDEQRTAFQQLRMQEGQTLNLELRRHVAKEMLEFKAGQLKGTVNNAVNSAIASSSDPKLIAVELSKAVTAIRQNAPALGVAPEEIEAQIRAVNTQVHTGVISQLLAEEKDQAATAYFETTKSQIDASQIDKITKALEEGTLRGQAQKEADAIMRAGGTRTEQREKAKAIEDSKLRDQVLQRIEHEHVIAEREEREQEQANQRRGYDILDKTPDVAKIPPDLWASYDGGTRSAMLSYARTRAKGEPVENDDATYYSLMAMAAEKPAEFSTWNLLKYRAVLGESEWKQLVGMQVHAKAGNREALDKEIAPFLSRKEAADQALVQHGVNPNAKAGTPEGEAVARLYRMLENRVTLLQGITNKKATNDDIRAEIDYIMSQSVTVPGSWWALWSPNKYDLSSKTRRLVDSTIHDVPAHERKVVEEALRQRNRPITDATILDLWMDWKMDAGQKKK